MLERLQKIIARAGISSRRGAEELIRQGRVHVNGRPAAIGASADPERDRITVDGVPVRSGRLVYYALYKPKGVVTTMGDEHGKRTVAGLAGVKRLKERVFPVGRLDCDAEGLLILTNDGDLANRIAHPRYGVTKTYRVLLDRTFEDVERLERGVVVEGRRVSIRAFRCRGNEVVITIHEGRTHIVKRLFRKLGYTVRSLKRTRIGRVRLGGLAPGGLRPLEREEIERSLGPERQGRGKGG